MHLRAYLSAHSLTQHAFADRVGCSQPQINRLVRGNSNPSLALMRRIMDATDGAVTFADWESVPHPEDPSCPSSPPPMGDPSSE